MRRGKFTAETKINEPRNTKRKDIRKMEVYVYKTVCAQLTYLNFAMIITGDDVTWNNHSTGIAGLRGGLIVRPDRSILVCGHAYSCLCTTVVSKYLSTYANIIHHARCGAAA